MSGGQRYWNEETQRWEDGTAGAPPATPPPPPPPAFSPSAPQGPDGGPAPDAARPDGDTGAWSRPEPPHTAPWPPTEGAAPAPAAGTRGPSRRVVWSVLSGAAVAGVAAALVLTLVVGGDGDGGGTDGGTTPTGASTAPTGEPSEQATDTPGPSLDETADPSGTSPVPPAGYEVYSDPEGFTVARPAGWTREAVASQHGIDVVTYRSSDGERRLQIFEVAEASPDESFELFLSEDTPKAEGFEQLSLENLDEGDFSGTRLEYLAASLKGGPDVGPWHVVDLRFQAADGKLYAIAAYGPDADGREDERELVETALGHFCPPYTECGTDAGLF